MLTKSYNENKYFFKNENNKSQVEKDIAIILSEEHEEDEMEM